MLEIYRYLFEEVTPQQVFFSKYKGKTMRISDSIAKQEGHSTFLNPSYYDASNVSFYYPLHHHRCPSIKLFKKNN